MDDQKNLQNVNWIEMKFKKWVKCDKCGKQTKNLRIMQNKWVCYPCWVKLNYDKIIWTSKNPKIQEKQK